MKVTGRILGRITLVLETYPNVDTKLLDRTVSKVYNFS